MSKVDYQNKVTFFQMADAYIKPLSADSDNIVHP